MISFHVKGKRSKVSLACVQIGMPTKQPFHWAQTPNRYLLKTADKTALFLFLAQYSAIKCLENGSCFATIYNSLRQKVSGETFKHGFCYSTNYKLISLYNQSFFIRVKRREIA